MVGKSLMPPVRTPNSRFIGRYIPRLNISIILRETHPAQW